ncbi:MAG: S46 family peptidase [Blastocatellia bacterium]
MSIKPRTTILTCLLILSLLVSPFGSWADEGMWLPGSISKLPLNELRKRGLELKPEQIYSTTDPSLKDAIVQISIGGTGAFISPDGLILTNHHVAFGAVTAASTPENDYINQGFLAKTRQDEIPARNYSIGITLGYEDVTEKVLSAVTPEMGPAERAAALAQRQDELAEEAKSGRDEIRTQVLEATGGYQFFLYTYLIIRDVRLVYAPPKSIGYYGGDPDNFEWPRHCGDFALLRAYVDKDGTPAKLHPENIPFKPKKFLPLNVGGVREGDFAMVLGYPGRTTRYRESYSIDYNQRVQLPAQIKSLRQRIESLTKLSEQNPELRIRLADQIFGLSNSLKNFEGTVLGLKRMDLVAKRRAEEEAFQKWIDSDPVRKTKYGSILPSIKALYDELNSFGPQQAVINEVLATGDLMRALELAYVRAGEAEKPAPQRIPQFSDPQVRMAMGQLNRGWGSRAPVNETRRLAGALALAADLPENQRIPEIEALFAGKSGADRRKAEEEFAKEAINKSRFQDFSEAEKLLQLSLSELKAIEDPLLRLVGQLSELSRPLMEKTRQFNGKILQLRPEYVRGLLEMRKSPYYPDANFTLRWTHGQVRGYAPRDAVTYDWQTSLRGVLEKDTGVEPFDAPPALRALYEKRDFGNYADPRLKDIPVNFLTTNDITGGNSGSPVMNGRGEVIGIAFDGNYEGLGGDFNFDPASNRTLSVDIRYMLFLLEKFAGASELIREMTIVQGKGAAVRR